jgi:hypothetical protein
MKLSDIEDLLSHYSSPTDWMRVNNENLDGGDTLVCLEDVLLCLKFNPVWNGDKPFLRMELSYASTVLSWADLPVGTNFDRPSHAEAIERLVGNLRSKIGNLSPTSGGSL